MNGQGSLTVSEVIKLMTRSNNQWGISGYTIPEFNAKLDKPSCFKITKTKRPSYIDESVKLTARMPAPGQYNTIDEGGMIDKRKKSSLERSPKLSFMSIIEKQELKKKFPGPGSYNARSKVRVLGAFSLKGEKTTFVDDAAYQGS